VISSQPPQYSPASGVTAPGYNAIDERLIKISSSSNDNRNLPFGKVDSPTLSEKKRYTKEAPYPPDFTDPIYIDKFNIQRNAEKRAAKMAAKPEARALFAYQRERDNEKIKVIEKERDEDKKLKEAKRKLKEALRKKKPTTILVKEVQDLENIYISAIRAVHEDQFRRESEQINVDIANAMKEIERARGIVGAMEQRNEWNQPSPQPSPPPEGRYSSDYSLGPSYNSSSGGRKKSITRKAVRHIKRTTVKRSKHKRSKHKRSKHKRSKHKRSKHKRSKHKRSKHKRSIKKKKAEHKEKAQVMN